MMSESEMTNIFNSPTSDDGRDVIKIKYDSCAPGSFENGLLFGLSSVVLEPTPIDPRGVVPVQKVSFKTLFSNDDASFLQSLRMLLPSDTSPKNIARKEFSYEGKMALLSPVNDSCTDTDDEGFAAQPRRLDDLVFWNGPQDSHLPHCHQHSMVTDNDNDGDSQSSSSNNSWPAFPLPNAHYDSNENTSSDAGSSGEGNPSSIFRSNQREQWNQRFQEMVEFRQKFGHCLVPLNWPTNPSLAHWVKRQRHQYRVRNEGKHSTLTTDRLEALEKLGFVWDSHAAGWEERWNQLRDFRTDYGHCRVPKKFPENPQLAVWVKCQRRQFKLFNEGKDSNMTEERIEKLASLGFVFSPRMQRNYNIPRY